MSSTPVTPVPQTQSLDFSTIPGHQQHNAPSISAPQPAPVRPEEEYDLGGKELGEAIDYLTGKIENYTQAGRATHPVLSRLGDVSRQAKELLFGGQSAGKPLGTSSGVVNNPVTQTLTAAEDAPELAENAVNMASKGISHLAETGKTAVQAGSEELGRMAEARTPSQSTAEAGHIKFDSIPGHQVHTPEIKSEGPQWDRVHKATVEGKPAGSIGYHVDPTGKAQIYGSAVPEGMRGQGIGQKLYKSAIEDARAGGAKTITSDPTNVSADASRVWQKLGEKGDYKVEPITHANGKPGFQVSLEEPKSANNDISESQRTATEPAKPHVSDAVKTAGGTYRGTNSHGLVEITLPREMTNKLPLQDRFKDFVSITLPEAHVTPETVKDAMAKKYAEMGGK